MVQNASELIKLYRDLLFIPSNKPSLQYNIIESSCRTIISIVNVSALLSYGLKYLVVLHIVY